MNFKMNTILFITAIFLQVLAVPTSGDCSLNCVASPSPSDATCDTSSGRCLHGCKPGYFGATCELSCCKGCQECRLKGSSSNEVVCNVCDDGFYKRGGECLECSVNCLQGCNRLTGKCNNGCKPGSYGPTCSQTCNDQCLNNNCHTNTGACIEGCISPVMTGHNCSEVCSRGCHYRECHQDSSCLLDGCVTGYWGVGCKTMCPTDCVRPDDPSLDVCDLLTGACLHGCKDTDRWGPQCADLCELTCGLPGDRFERVCDQHTGVCLHGCNETSHAWGPTCTTPCDYKCQTTGVANRKICSDMGECLHGCYHNTHWGPSCDRECGTGCKDGLCYKDNGACRHGCVEGYEGEKCDMKDLCFLPDGWVIALISVLACVIVIQLIVNIYCYCSRKRDDDDAYYPEK